MMFDRCLSTLVLLTASILSLSVAEDVLISKRSLEKRQANDQGNFNISFYHINDVHAHLDEFSSSGTDCTRPERGCYGGYARVKSVLDETRPGKNNSLLLNAGDEFQGTLFYTFYGGEKIAETLNQIGFDGMTLGNHEFDAGDDVLGQFLENLTFPIVSANIISDHPILNATIKPYHIYDQYQLAIIGVTTEETPGISRPGANTIFTNVAEAVQNTINIIRNTTNITRIAALTHIGYEEDQRLARETSGLHLIMGGHSHTLLLPTDDAEASDSEGPYPTIENNLDGEEVFIVTAYRWGEYLGYIDVIYDETGRILEYRGAPFHLTNTTTQNAELQAQIETWRGPFEAFAAEVVGESLVELDQTTCQRQECLLGDFMADAMLAYRRNQSSSSPNTPLADFALINAGGIRATIDAGPITRGEILTSFPFGNSIVEITLSPADLTRVLEGIVSETSQFNGEEVTSFFQISTGITVSYNPDAEPGSRLRDVSVNGRLVSDAAADRVYRIVTLDFLAGGGDNFFEPTTDFVALDLQDQVLTNYIIQKTPVDIALDQRIRITNETASVTGTATTSGASTSSTAQNGAASMQIGCRTLIAMLIIGIATAMSNL